MLEQDNHEIVQVETIGQRYCTANFTLHDATMFTVHAAYIDCPGKYASVGENYRIPSASGSPIQYHHTVIVDTSKKKGSRKEANVL